MRLFRIPLVLALAVLVLGATCNTGPALLGSGESLKLVGNQWLAANAELVKACVPSAPRLDKQTCDDARAFGVKFKTTYPLALQLFEAAVNANDAGIAGDAKDVIRRLSVDLVAFAAKVGLTFQEVN